MIVNPGKRSLWSLACSFCLLLGGLLLAGCSHSSPPPSSAASNPVPSISSLSPVSANQGAAAQTLTITGNNFLSSSTVTYNGAAHTAAYVSATQLTIQLSASDQATAGNYPVVVSNPAPGGGSSSPANFAVNAPTPAISSLSPASTYPCNPVNTLTITGTNFNANSTVSFNGSAVTATYISATQLTIALTSAQIAAPGNDAIVVSNPAPGGGASNAQNFVVNSPAGPTLSGNTALAATVQAFDLNSSDLSNGTLECTVTSDASSGNFSMTLNAPPSGGLRLASSGGQIIYDGMSNGQPAAQQLSHTSAYTAIFESIPSTGIANILLDPISSFADQLTYGFLNGTSDTVAQAHAEAGKLLNGFYQFSGTTPLELQPTNTTDVALRLTAVEGYETEGLALNANSPDDIVAALASDISDRFWNGFYQGVSGYAAVPLGAGTLPFTAGNTDYLDAVVSWIQGGGTAMLSSSLASTVSVDLTAGLTSSPLISLYTGLDASNSGALATLAWQGHQYLIINSIASPQNSGGVAVVDVTHPAAASSPTVNFWSWSALNGLFTSGTSDTAGGLAVIAGHQPYPEVFVYDGGGGWAMLDAATLISGTPGTDNPIEAEGTYNISAPIINQPTSGATVSAAAWDGCWNGCQIELSTIAGYMDFNYATDQLDTTVYPVQDPNESYAENVAGDLSYGISVGGSYDSVLLAGNMGGVQLVDYTTKASYYIPDVTFSSYYPNFPALGNDVVDGNAIDPASSIAIFTPELLSGSGVEYVGLMNLNGITETAGANGSLNTFAPPAGGTAEVQLDSSGVGFTGASMTTDEAVFKGANSTNNIAVGKLQPPPASGTWAGLSDWVFYSVGSSPSLAAFQDQGDPHGVVALQHYRLQVQAGAGFIQTNDYGYVLDNSGTGVLQIDMTGLLAMPRQGSSGDLAHEVTGDPAATNATATGSPVLREFTW